MRGYEKTHRRWIVLALVTSFLDARAQVLDEEAKAGARRMRAGAPSGMRIESQQDVRVLGYDPSSILIRSPEGTNTGTTLSVSGMRMRRVARTGQRVSTAQRTERYQLEPGVDPNAAIAALKARGIDAQLNVLYSTLKAPNDPKYGQQWGLKNTTQTIVRVPGGSAVSIAANPPPASAAGMDIGAEQAWETITDCSSVVVAVIDSGVRSTHEDLATNMWDDGQGHHGYSFVHDSFDAEDEIGHGTHVAATIAAVGNNALGGSGVCWKARIMSVQVIDKNDRGFTSDVTAGIYWAVDRGAKVINMSLGGSGDDPELRTAMKYAEDHDVVVVVAAGNSAVDNDTTSTIPANYVGSAGLSVAALRQDGTLASFSNFGRTKVHLGAPGNNVLSAIGAESDTNHPDMKNGWTHVAVPGTGESPPTNPNWGWGTLTVQSEAQDGKLANVRNFYDTGAPTYRPSSKDYTYRTADLRPVNGWLPSETTSYFGFFGEADIHASDHLALRCSPNAATPNAPELLPAADGGLAVGSLTGSSRGSLVLRDFRLPDACRTANATIGFALVADGSNERKGAVVYSAEVSHVHALNTAYDVYRGTSMAAPHVAGVAALLRAYRPYANARRIVADILASVRPVESLKTKTVSGGIVNAAAALGMVAPPTNVTAKVVVE